MQELPWSPFLPARPVPAPEERIAALAAASGLTVDAVREKVAEEHRNGRMFQNSRYTVLVRDVPHTEVTPGRSWPRMVWLSIRRNDRGPVRNWRDLQRIKNELVGPENEGVELFPAESRLADTANQYHLWVLAQPGILFPFGMRGRCVCDHDADIEAATNTRQEPLEKDGT